MNRPDPSELLKVWNADAGELREMCRIDKAEAEAEARSLEAEMQQLDERDPRMARLRERSTDALARARAAQNMNTWMHSKGLSK